MLSSSARPDNRAAGYSTGSGNNAPKLYNPMPIGVCGRTFECAHLRPRDDWKDLGNSTTVPIIANVQRSFASAL